jgi:hypothetical protein
MDYYCVPTFQAWRIYVDELNPACIEYNCMFQESTTEQGRGQNALGYMGRRSQVL